MVAATGSGLRNARPALSVTLGSRPPSERSGSLLPIADRGIHFAARALRNSPENRHTKLFALLAPASTRSTPTNSGHYDSFRRRLTESLPYGVYDMLNNQGWVSVGIDHDTAQFATRSILLWWTEMGSARFPHARRLLITADGGGSNSHRSRLWKLSLQELANETGLKLVVCHFPPGTSKWNKIEHRLFSYITQNWQGEPLATLQTIVELIGSTTTKGGLKVRARLDTKSYETGIKVTDEELAAVKLERHETHGSWNYTIKPSK